LVNADGHTRNEAADRKIGGFILCGHRLDNLARTARVASTTGRVRLNPSFRHLDGTPHGETPNFRFVSRYAASNRSIRELVSAGHRGLFT